jgi:transposase-like protein
MKLVLESLTHPVKDHCDIYTMKNATHPFQFNSLIEFFQSFPTNEACKAHLKSIRWAQGVGCVKCASMRIHTRKCGFRFVCLDCRNEFTVTSGTVFEGSKVPMQKWYLAMYFLSTNVKGMSSYQLAEKLKVTQATAWFLAQRLQYALNESESPALVKGVAQVDETWVGGLEGNKHKSKRTKGTQGKGSAKTKTMVAGIRDSHGNVIAEVTEPTNEAIREFVHANVEKGAILMTDENKAYSGMRKNYDHRAICHRTGEFASGIDNDTTVNGVENYWSHLKRMIMGTYHQISPKHLQKYVSAQSFRYNNRNESDFHNFTATVRNCEGKRITLEQLKRGA